MPPQDIAELNWHARLGGWWLVSSMRSANVRYGVINYPEWESRAGRQRTAVLSSKRGRLDDRRAPI